MPRISQLDPLAGLSKLDMFEVTQRATNKSCSITAQEMGNYFKTLQNGAFRGSTTKALDDFTVEDVGVWYWTGDGGVTGLGYGIVEIISPAGSDDDNLDAKYIQKLTCNNRVYQRMYNDRWSNWAALTNRNGAIIEYGISSDSTVTFPQDRFNDVPTVICVPLNDNYGTYIYSVNLTSVTRGSFTVQKKKSSLIAVVEQTVETETETTKTTTTTVTQGAWEDASDMSFYWIALSDVE